MIFLNPYISLWDGCLKFLKFHINELAFGCLGIKQFILVAFPFSSQILVCATGFCSSKSLFIWRFTFGELFKQKQQNKSGKIYRHRSMHVSRSTKPFTNHSWQGWRSIYNNHIDFKISSTLIWVHRKQAKLVDAQSH